jgi:hypothetical protein
MSFTCIISPGEAIKKVTNIEFHAENDDAEILEFPLCIVCQMDCDDSCLLICDGCNTTTTHTYCDGLETVPIGDWLCFRCRNERLVD